MVIAYGRSTAKNISSLHSPVFYYTCFVNGHNKRFSEIKILNFNWKAFVVYFAIVTAHNKN